MSNRLVRRYFKCYKCKDIESQLIHPNKFQIKCSKCGAFLNEIQEKEFKILKKNKNHNNQNNEHKVNNDAPYMPSENAFRNISSVYNRPPSHSNNQRQNQNINNNQNNRNRFNNINNNNNQQERNRRYQSTNHYSEMNIVNDNDINNNNINNNNINNINNNYNNRNNINPFRESQNRFNINNNNSNINANNQNENSEENERRRNYGQGARNRERSQDPMNSSFFNNFFNNIFGGMFGIPINMSTPIIISSSGQGQPYRIYIQRQNVPQNIFDPLFLSFGSMFNNNFRDNFSSNFRSNFRGDFLSEIIRIIQRNQEEAARRAHPPTSESALKKLKRFPLTEKYCKKNKNGKIELPSCCICLSDIEKNEETVLLPCGHMFHWNCCLSWLKSNNTCPMCRFVIKD